MTPEEKAALVDEIVDIYESEPDTELEEALEKARLMAKTFEALLEERRQGQTDRDSDTEQAKAFIIEAMEKARLALRETNNTEPEILTPDDINRIVVPRARLEEEMRLARKR
jgi:hypothetical protein